MRTAPILLTLVIAKPTYATSPNPTTPDKPNSPGRGQIVKAVMDAIKAGGRRYGDKGPDSPRPSSPKPGNDRDKDKDDKKDKDGKCTGAACSATSPATSTKAPTAADPSGGSPSGGAPQGGYATAPVPSPVDSAAAAADAAPTPAETAPVYSSATGLESGILGLVLLLVV